MNTNVTFHIDDSLLMRFQMALQLNNDTADQVIESLLRGYVVRSFSQAAATYNNPISHVATQVNDSNYAKAINRIPKWARKPQQINHRIIRAYLQLAELGPVTYDQLAQQCNNSTEHPDVYVPTFNSNFAQMKFDGDKSHGKVFEVDSNGQVTIWAEVESCLLAHKDSFMK